MAHPFFHQNYFVAGGYAYPIDSRPVQRVGNFLLVDPRQIYSGNELTMSDAGYYSFRSMNLPSEHSVLSQVQPQQATLQARLSADASTQTKTTQSRHNAVVYFGDDLRLEGSKAAVMRFLNGSDECSSDEESEIGNATKPAVTMPSEPEGLDASVEIQFGSFLPDNYDANFPALSAPVAVQSTESVKTETQSSSPKQSTPVVEENTTTQNATSASAADSAIQLSTGSASPELESRQTKWQKKVDADKDFKQRYDNVDITKLLDQKPNSALPIVEVESPEIKIETPADIQSIKKEGHASVDSAPSSASPTSDTPSLTTKQRYKLQEQARKERQVAARAERQKQAVELKKQAEQKRAEEQAKAEAAQIKVTAEVEDQSVSSPVQQQKKEQHKSLLTSAVQDVQKPPTASTASAEIKKKTDAPPVVVKSPVVSSKPAAAESASVASSAAAELSEQFNGKIPPPPNYYQQLPEPLLDFRRAILGFDRTAGDMQAFVCSGKISPRLDKKEAKPLWHVVRSEKAGLTYTIGELSNGRGAGGQDDFYYVGGLAFHQNHPKLFYIKGPGFLVRADGAVFCGEFSSILETDPRDKSIQIVIPLLSKGQILTPEGYLIKITHPVCYNTLLQPRTEDGRGGCFPSSLEIYSPKSSNAYKDFLQRHCEVGQQQFELKKKFMDSVSVSDEHWQLCYEGGVTRTSGGELAAHGQNVDLRMGNYAFRGQMWNGIVFETSSKIYHVDARENKTLIYEGELHSELHKPEPSAANLGRPKLGYFYTDTKNYYGTFSVNDEGRTLSSGASGPLPAKGQPATSTAGHRQIDIAEREPSFTKIPPIVFKIDI